MVKESSILVHPNQREITMSNYKDLAKQIEKLPKPSIKAFKFEKDKKRIKQYEKDLDSALRNLYWLIGRLMIYTKK